MDIRKVLINPMTVSYTHLIANELNKIGVNMSEDVAKPWLSAKNAANQYMNAMKEAEAKSKITSQKIDTSKREDASVIQSIAPKPSEKGAEKPQAPAPQQPSKPSGPKSPNDLGLDPSPCLLYTSRCV